MKFDYLNIFHVLACTII